MRKKAAEDFSGGDIERFEAGSCAFDWAQQIINDGELMGDGNLESAGRLMREDLDIWNSQVYTDRNIDTTYV